MIRRRPSPRQGPLIVSRALALVPLVGALLVACSSGNAATSPGEGRLPVLATTTILADIVRNVGGDCVSVDSIVPAGVSPRLTCTT